MNHDLKIDDVFLKAKLAGDKLFEIRINDKGYQKGDTVTYKEYLFDTVKEHIYEITYVTSYAQQGEHVVFGERHIKTE